jgi:para-aminobenzoate synthetase/4-amino-4-deoxychorismate lyase
MNSNGDVKNDEQTRARKHRDKDFELLETLLWTPEDGYFVLDEHEARLTRSAEEWGFSCSAGKFRRVLMDACADLPACAHRVRVLMNEDGEFTIEATTQTSDAEPIRVGLAAEPVDVANRFLYHKTTRREVYEHALRSGFDDVILYNERNEVTESCRANVVVLRDGVKLTPPVSCGLLGGTFRAHLLESGAIQEGIVMVDGLKEADEVFLINSVRKWINIELAM